MPSRRVDLPENTVTDLKTAGALIDGQRYGAQNRSSALVYVAELTATDPVARDVTDAAFIIPFGQYWTLTPVAGVGLYGYCSDDGRLTVGDIP